MTGRLILTGDVNLMNVADATVPFRHVASALHDADVVFGNLECCLHLPSRQSHATEGFFADRRKNLRWHATGATADAGNIPDCRIPRRRRATLTQRAGTARWHRRRS